MFCCCVSLHGSLARTAWRYRILPRHKNVVLARGRSQSSPATTLATSIVSPLISARRFGQSRFLSDPREQEHGRRDAVAIRAVPRHVAARQLKGDDYGKCAEKILKIQNGYVPCLLARIGAIGGKLPEPRGSERGTRVAIR
ncbi:hypothetical protein LMG27174_01211 [Paraburkholderia rhynchosiae]|uniref:Uncharacterized protein n=1 Tax=Paraburkholderia rhynchosiae TaxID=487049 RepID=A0A6J5A8F7_9BURK|nr:hypothetical protein LMG27174_01211 [Paraburkholderia rhynchosiae]